MRVPTRSTTAFVPRTPKLTDVRTRPSPRPTGRVGAVPAVRGTPLRVKSAVKYSGRSDSLRVAATATDAPLGVFKLEYDISKDDATKSADWNEPVIVAVSGAAGQISNHLLFKIASGEVYGQDQPVALRLLGSENSREALEGVAMELEDSLFPLLREVSIGIDPMDVFVDADWALLIGAKPRGPGMERADLLEMNGAIFVEQGKAQLVCIAHDVDPIELVIWLPALCRQMNVPYCIVKGKARLGAVVHKKTATALALTGIKNEDKMEFSQLVEAIKGSYNDKFDKTMRTWGGGIMGVKSQAKTAARQRVIDKELKQREAI